MPAHTNLYMSKVTLALNAPMYCQQILHMFFLRRSLAEFAFKINQPSRRPDETH